ncbi:hypothetical protein IWX49DRAFT_556760 [Phyllosticta citricarpa]
MALIFSPPISVFPVAPMLGQCLTSRSALHTSYLTGRTDGIVMPPAPPMASRAFLPKRTRAPMPGELKAVWRVGKTPPTAKKDHKAQHAALPDKTSTSGRAPQITAL